MSVCVCVCVSGPSDDLEHLLELDDQLPVGSLHVVSEPVLQSVDRRPRDLKHQNTKTHQSVNHQVFTFKTTFKEVS